MLPTNTNRSAGLQKACFEKEGAVSSWLDKLRLPATYSRMRKSDRKVRTRGASSDVSDRLPAERCLWVVHVQGAKRREIANLLSPEEFFALCYSPCDYCGRAPFNATKWPRQKSVLYNGIDRVDNSKPYSRANCVPCCKDCNSMKSARTRESFISLCRTIARHSGSTC